MTGPRDDPARRPDPSDDPNFDSEAAYGGADAIEKTSYVVGSGTDPEARNVDPVIAKVEPGAGLGPLGVAVIGLAVLLALLYGIGLFT